MIIYGKNAIIETMEADKAVYKLMVAMNLKNDTRNPVINLAKKKGVKIEFVNRNVLDKLSSNGSHQGFVAETEDFQYSSVDEILQLAQQKGEQPFVVILDGVEDPHNLGSIIRVCECAGVHGVIIPKHRACQVNETVAKTSAGALSHIKIAKVTNLNQVIDELEEKIIEPEELNINIEGNVMDRLKYNLDEDYLVEMYTNILISDMDSRTKNKCHVCFVEILKQLSKNDLEVLNRKYEALLIEIISNKECVGIAKLDTKITINKEGKNEKNNNSSNNNFNNNSNNNSIK